MLHEYQLNNKPFNQVIAKAWLDDSFREKLLSNPKSVLEEENIDLPLNFDFSNFTIPAKPEFDIEVLASNIEPSSALWLAIDSASFSCFMCRS